MRHAVSQLFCRMTEKMGCDAVECLKTAKRIAGHHPTGSVAFQVAQLPFHVGTPWGSSSNGNELWAIVRDGDLVTMMLRRSVQPKTPEALRVDKIVRRRFAVYEEWAD